MNPIPRSYDKLLAYLYQHLEAPDSQLHNLALWVYGLFKTRNCHLGHVADELPLEGQKDSLIQRLKRGLMNPRLVPEVLYRRLLIPWMENRPRQPCKRAW